MSFLSYIPYRHNYFSYKKHFVYYTPESNKLNPESVIKTKDKTTNSNEENIMYKRSHGLQCIQKNTIISAQEKNYCLTQVAEVDKGILSTKGLDYLKKQCLPRLKEAITSPEKNSTYFKQLIAFHALEKEISPLIEKKRFNEAISIIQEFINSNSGNSANDILRLKLINTVIQKTENTINTPSWWSQNGVQRFLDNQYKIIEKNLDELIKQGDRGGKLAIFHLQSLYHEGKIELRNPLFQKLLILDPSFKKIEVKNFKKYQQYLEKQLIDTSRQLKNEDLPEKQKKLLITQRKVISSEITNNYLKRYFPEEINRITLQAFKNHDTYKKWHRYGGEGKKKCEQAIQNLKTLQGEWFSLIQKLQKQGIKIPTYSNGQSDKGIIFCPTLGREAELKSGDIILNAKEKKLKYIMIGVNFASIVGAVYTAGIGSAAAREGFKKFITNALARDALAISLAGGSTFSVSLKSFNQILAPKSIAGEWSVKKIIEDIPRDIILFSVLRAATMKFSPELGVSVSRLSNPITQTGLEAGTLIGFQQGERLIKGERLIEAIQKLPNDILYTLMFLIALKKVQFTIEKITTDIKSGETKIAYSGDKEKIINALNNNKDVRAPEIMENGNIKVKIGEKTVTFIPIKKIKTPNESQKTPEIPEGFTEEIITTPKDIQAMKELLGEDVTVTEIQKMLTVYHPAYKNAKSRIDIFADKKEFGVTKEIYSESGETLLILARSIHKNKNGKLIGYPLSISSKIQKEGIGTKLHNNFIEFCKKRGIKKIEVTAADIGRYIWAKNGHYEFAKKDTAGKWQQWLEQYLADHNYKIGVELKELTKPEDFAKLKTTDGKSIGEDFILKRGKKREGVENWKGIKIFK